MRLRHRVLSAFVAAGLAALLVPRVLLAAPDDGLGVAIEAGRVVGVEEDGVRVFKGIPYAAPPVGPLRWKPPLPPARWTGERAADRFGPACAQLDGARMAEAKSQIHDRGVDLWVGVPMTGREDCLTLNIWAPKTARKAPVIVYLYGAAGSADMPYWNGSAFARDGVVLVNFNHRYVTQGRFAHPALTREAGPKAPLTRFDTMDQIALLQWVKRNIAAFGGDPNNVTIAGVSAGGAAVLQLMTVPTARGLFHKAAVQSGVGWWSMMSQAEYERLGVMAARHAGLPGAEATAEQLRATPLERFPQIGINSWDGRLFPMSPTEAFAAGKAVDVPLLIGWNSFDGSSLRADPNQLIASTAGEVLATYDRERLKPQELAYALWTDVHVAAPARWIAKKTAAGAPTYLYYFSHVLSARRGTVPGAAHGSEIPYVFDNWTKVAPGLALAAEDQKVARTVHACWVSFARTGRPACDGAPAWPRYTAAKDQVMELSASPRVLDRFQAARLDAHEAAMADDIAAQRASLEKLLREGF